uniref:Secreted protein n=1 Tax=Globodera pallida TaxID=36090 RepID=A0A183BZE0_GLOPA
MKRTLLVLPVLAAVNGHDNVNQRVQRAASPNLPEIMAEGQAVGTGMEKRRRRGTKLKALAGQEGGMSHWNFTLIKNSSDGMG